MLFRSGAIAGTEDITALPLGVREEAHDYIEEGSATASLFPSEPIKSAAFVCFESDETAMPTPTSTTHTTRTTNTSTDGDGSDGSDIPF